MKVAELIKMEKAGAMFRVVDATRTGYMVRPQTLLVADRNVVTDLYGDFELAGFEAAKKKEIIIYVK